MSLSDQFESLTLADIDNYLALGQEENIYLDFKRINRPDLGHADDKKTLAKAISGFANSSGGLIVWGIDARKNPAGVDCATDRVEIDPLSLFISRLNELTSRAVSPIVEGVRHKPIIVSGDKGFAVTLVPESDSGPHMAKLGEDRYYKRSGDTFYRMEHYDLEDMFGRRKRPKLVLATRVTGTRPDITIYLGLMNIGRGAAKAPYLAFQTPAPFRLSMYELGSGNPGLPKLHNAGQSLPYRYGANSNFVIHPGTVHEVTSIWLGHTPREEDCPRGNIEIEYEVAAEDIQLTRLKASVNLDVV